MELLLGAVGLAALTAKVVDFFRLLANLSTHVSATLTQILAWVGGIVATALYANSDFGESVAVGANTLDKLSGPTLVIIGMMAASAASLLVDVKQAIDGADTAAKPPLLK